ncbi:bifunctional 4-hydroxy-2-oxoglutarate aldolase/2-dehydro-3-deoxy-phosphogluconate aldolase [Paenibacillus sp. NRS-1760]|uniref:bifunctional 4-hydroxy-2-oxoglutarate aldolase/2-dehydro-3-deoxy-phosphogluconate aldolase n=1 Tax=Paenibacillus sp. NRS-1760 TaxID=3233902 RepID=UPI003D2DD29F
MLTVKQQIEMSKVVAILRNVPLDRLPRVMEALYDGGIRVAEITLNSEYALDGIRVMRKTYEGRMAIGAGTVVSKENVNQAIDAGAEFLISPHVDERIIDAALSRSSTPIPGALTPTEILRATAAGAPLVKLFPCTTFGPGYMKELLAPLNNVKFIAVGGVTAPLAASYIQAGAIAVGAGSGLVSHADVMTHNYTAITSNARELVRHIESSD